MNESGVRVSLTDTEHINYYGRNHVTGEKVTFLNSLSGFEVRFSGKTLTAVFSRRGPGPVGGGEINPPTLLRMRVYADGDMSVGNSRVIVLDGGTDGRETVLARFENDGEHTVLVRKMNYDWWGYIEMTALSCDGVWLPAPEKTGKKLLVYGDSITVGFGDEYRATGDTGGDVPEKEDGTRTYSALLADHFGAQIAEYCNSGVSIGVPCWREKAIMQENYWQQYAYFDTGSVFDMTSYVPELVICNLGTNDNGGLADGCSNFGNGTAYAPAGHYKPSDLRKAYADFIAVMKRHYPDAAVIICYGMMGTGPSVSQAIFDAVAGCGYDDVYFLNFRMVECSENAGHPTLDGQADAFGQLLAYLDRHHIQI